MNSFNLQTGHVPNSHFKIRWVEIRMHFLTKIAVKHHSWFEDTKSEIFVTPGFMIRNMYSLRGTRFPLCPHSPLSFSKVLQLPLILKVIEQGWKVGWWVGCHFQVDAGHWFFQLIMLNSHPAQMGPSINWYHECS